MRLNPWHRARLTERNESGSSQHFETPEGSVDVFDPRKSDGTDIPGWALYMEVEEVRQAHPDWSSEEVMDGARNLFISRRVERR